MIGHIVINTAGWLNAFLPISLIVHQYLKLTLEMDKDGLYFNSNTPRRAVNRETFSFLLFSSDVWDKNMITSKSAHFDFFKKQNHLIFIQFFTLK